jgi:hypothetical protein
VENPVAVAIPDRSREVVAILVATLDRNPVVAAATPVRSPVVVAIPVRSPAVVVIPVRSRAADDNPNPLTFSEPDDFVRLFFSVELH